MNTKYIILGGRGGAVVLGEQIYDAQKSGAPVEFLGYAFDDESLGGVVNDFPILCKTYEARDRFAAHADVRFIYQMWRPDLMRERIALLARFEIPPERFGTFVHPTAVVAQSAVVSAGCSILAHAVVNSNAVLGAHCTVHSGCLVGHDTQLGDYNFVAGHSAIGSNNRIGDANFFGLNCSINNKIVIGSGCFIGMAANVVRSVEDGQMVVGNPARVVERRIKPL
jgi:acetyltransferase EpsM